MTTVLAAIKDNGIADRDIQTSRLSLQPQYDPNKAGTARLTGFQANNQVTVRIRDIDKLPALLDRAIAAGANEMSGIEFVVSEQSKLLDQARNDAVADARRKAELYREGGRRQAWSCRRDYGRRLGCTAAANASPARQRGSNCPRRADVKGDGHR